jgi:hypothetical protein
LGLVVMKGASRWLEACASPVQASQTAAAQLLARCRSGLGDRAAAVRYGCTSAPAGVTPAFAVVLRIQRDRALAEDLLQEVYVSVWKAAAGFDAARSQPLTWLTHIARNRAIDSLRRQAGAAAAGQRTPGGPDDDDDAPTA